MSRSARSSLFASVVLATLLTFLGAGAVAAAPKKGSTSTTTSTTSAPASSTSTSSSTACPAPATASAKLLVSVQSSSPDVKVHVSPTTVTARKDLRSSGGAVAGYAADGVRVQTPAGATGSLTTELIAVDAARAPKLTVVLEKTSGGKATVSVASTQAGVSPVKLSASGTTTSIQVTVDRARLFNPSWSLPKADSRKLVLAAYYPWFTRTDYDNPQLAERPLDPRSVWSQPDVLSMTQQARNAGVDGFVVSWMGAEKNGSAYAAAMAAAEQTNGYVAPYLEVAEALNKAGIWGVRMWLAEAIDATGPASLKIDGVPVVFVWDMAKLPPADWQKVLDSVGKPVRLVGDADTNTYGAVMNGWHRYLPLTDLTGEGARSTMQTGWMRGTPALQGLTPKLYVSTVSPGFDDRNLRGADRPVVSREDNRYDKTWDVALASDPDMVLITSWNEWFEGSEIEPGARWGSTALETTARRATAWKAGQHVCPTA